MNRPPLFPSAPSPGPALVPAPEAWGWGVCRPRAHLPAIPPGVKLTARQISQSKFAAPSLSATDPHLPQSSGFVQVPDFDPSNFVAHHALTGLEWLMTKSYF